MFTHRQRYTKEVTAMRDCFAGYLYSYKQNLRLTPNKKIACQLNNNLLKELKISSFSTLQSYFNAAKYLCSLRYPIGFTKNVKSDSIANSYDVQVSRPKPEIMIKALNYYKYLVDPIDSLSHKRQQEMSIYYAGLFTDSKYVAQLPEKSIK